MPSPKTIHLFERLRSLGLISKGEVDRAAIQRLSRTRGIDLARELTDLTAARHQTRHTSLFAHSASLSLGGGRQYCSSTICRTERALALAQFSVLYSDAVYVKNFLADHVPHPGGINHKTDERFQESFYDDIVILNHLEPALTSRRLVLFTPPLTHCPHCLVVGALDRESSARLDIELH
jgi:hypothetical protein